MPLEQRPVASPFGFASEARDVLAGIDLTGRTAVVTGGASGLGVETVRALARAGAHVIMPVRNRESGENVAAGLREATGNDAIEVADMDLADFDSVRAFADGMIGRGLKIDILINNAGIMATPERRIMGRFESQFGTNHLGHMLLAQRLAPIFAPGARVVALSSIGHRISPVRFDDPNFDNGGYEKWTAYGQSKTANALFALALNARLEPRGVTAFSVHPGGIMTNLQRDMSQDEIRALGWVDENGKVRDGFKTPAGGAATALWAATSPLLTAGGVYCEDCNVAVAVDAGEKAMSGIRPWAMDSEAAERLWAMSEVMLGEKLPA